MPEQVYLFRLASLYLRMGEEKFAAMLDSADEPRMNKKLDWLDDITLVDLTAEQVRSFNALLETKKFDLHPTSELIFRASTSIHRHLLLRTAISHTSPLTAEMCVDAVLLQKMEFLMANAKPMWTAKSEDLTPYLEAADWIKEYIDNWIATHVYPQAQQSFESTRKRQRLENDPSAIVYTDNPV